MVTIEEMKKTKGHQVRVKVKPPALFEYFEGYSDGYMRPQDDDEVDAIYVNTPSGYFMLAQEDIIAIEILD